MPTYTLRKISDLAPGDHLCCLYETDEERQALVVPFIRQGLERGEKVLYVVAANSAGAVLGCLRDDGLGVDPHLTRGHVSILNVDEAFKREGVPGPEGMITLLRSESERALAEGYTALRVTGEMTWALAGLPDSNRLIEFEARLNTFFHGSKCLGICLYDRRRFDPMVLLGVLATHPMVVVGAELCDNSYYVPPTDNLGHDLQAATVAHWLEELKNAAARKRVEQSVQGTKAFYERLVGEAGDAIIVLDPYGIILTWNTGAERLFGWTAQEALGHSWTALQGTDVAEGIMKNLAQSFAGESLSNIEMRRRRKDGAWFDALLTVSPVRNTDGEVIAVQGIIKDITERKRAETALRRTHDELERGVQERTAELSRAIEFLEEQIAERKRVQEALHESKEHFRRLVETVNVIPWEADLATWRFTYVGPQAVRILGYAAEEWSEDGFWVNHIHPEDRDYAVKYCVEASSQGQDFEFEYRMAAADGRVLWMRDIVTVVPRVDGSSKLRGFMLDITEPKRIEEQLRSSQDQLRALSTHLRTVQEEERARIAREVHDELGQALTALKIDLAWIAQRLGGEQGDLQTKIQAMTHLVDGTVQAVRRIATELRPGLLDHLGLVAALEWQVREFQERTGLTCVFTKSPKDFVVDTARATALFRICQEALTNVARHAQATRVDISLRKVDRKLVLEVRDNGRGISEDAVADPQSMGLLGMRERVLPWGGTIRIRGARAKGTVVTVHLPLGEAALPGGLS